MKKVTFCVFVDHEWQKLFRGINFFIRRVLPSNFVVVTFLLTSLRKGYFLRRRLKRYRLLIEKIAVLMLFDIRLQASSRISMRNRCVYDGWVMYIFSSIMPTFFTRTSPLRTSAPPRKHMWATVYRRHVPLSFRFQFALKLFNTSGSINEILAFTQNICCVDVYDA